jgi:hypothetical protein
MPKDKPVTTTIEDGYFHISNSGLTFRLLEKATPSSKDGFGPYLSWEVEIRLGAFGHGVSFRFPIVANMAEYFANVFGRLHQRMLDLRMSGDYKSVNGESTFSRVNDVKVSIADGLNFHEILNQEGHLAVQRSHSASGDSDGNFASSINYHAPGMEDQGEGSDLEKKWKARRARLRELKAPLGNIRTDGGAYSLLSLSEDLLKSTWEMTWDDTWTDGPARGKKAKKAIGDYFVKNPEQFKVYTPGFSEAMRRLVLNRLGIVDQELIAECLQVKSEGQATS